MGLAFAAFFLAPIAALAGAFAFVLEKRRLALFFLSLAALSLIYCVGFMGYISSAH